MTNNITALILIDVQKGFVSLDGTLRTCFGLEETQPIRETFAKICAILPKAIDSFPVLMVRSEYRPGQFTDGSTDHDLSYLCVPSSRNSDCEWPSEFENLISPCVKVVTKKRHSAFSSPDFISEIDNLLKKGIKKFVLGGFLATSCVRKSALDLALYLRDIDARVTVCLELSGARASYCSNGETKLGSGIECFQIELVASGVLVKDHFDECLR